MNLPQINEEIMPNPYSIKRCQKHSKSITMDPSTEPTRIKQNSQNDHEVILKSMRQVMRPGHLETPTDRQAGGTEG